MLPLNAACIDKDNPYEKLFAENYQNYPGTVPHVLGQQTEGRLQEALQHYETGEYEKTLSILRTISASEPDNTVVRFYAGTCHLSLDRPQPAIASLLQVLTSEDTTLQEQAEWYLALA